LPDGGEVVSENVAEDNMTTANSGDGRTPLASASVKHHVIISGTGRAGTTFLVQLFTTLGLDTGFANTASGIHSNCNAGMEIDLRKEDAPYIVKNPWLCDHLDEVIKSGRVVVDHAILPMRDLFAAAESRRRVSSEAASGVRSDEVPGGLWHTTRPEDQEVVLTRQLYKLLIALAEHGIPVTLLHFPRLAIDAEYLYGKLNFLLNGVTREVFDGAFRSVSHPNLIHDFSVGSVKQ
jgi:hypothetical protein